MKMRPGGRKRPSGEKGKTEGREREEEETTKKEEKGRMG